MDKLFLSTYWTQCKICMQVIVKVEHKIHHDHMNNDASNDVKS